MFKVIPWIGFEVKKEAWILGSPDLPCEQRTAWSSVSTSVKPEHVCGGEGLGDLRSLFGLRVCGSLYADVKGVTLSGNNKLSSDNNWHQRSHTQDISF